MGKKKGFSLIELLLVVAIIAILAKIVLPDILRFYRVYKFNEYAYTLESVAKWGKIVAMEKSTNIGLCLEEKTLKVVDMGASRSGVCNGDTIKAVEIEDDFVNISSSASLGEPGPAFDPRGLAIYSGNICITDGNRFFKLCFQSNRGFIVVKEGKGGCGPC